MIKEMIEDLKLHRVSYLVEIMQKGDFDKKIDALKKISKIKITKNIGLFLIDSSKYDYGINDNNGGISSELISLCFKNYYDEYTNAIKKVFDRLDEDSKNRVVFLLSSIDNESALQLYVDLVLKNYKDSKFIPVSNLFERPYLYTFLFPKLSKALRFKNPRNNILILLNDYLNAEVVDKVDLRKNKKLISDACYPNVENFPVLEIRTTPGYFTLICEAIQDMYRSNLGIDILIKSEEYNATYQAMIQKDYDLARTGWTADFSDPMAMLNFFSKTSAVNHTGFESEEFNNLLEFASKTQNQKERMEALHKAENILFDYMPVIPIIYRMDPFMISPKLKGAIFNPLGRYKFNYAYIEK